MNINIPIILLLLANTISNAQTQLDMPNLSTSTAHFMFMDDKPISKQKITFSNEELQSINTNPTGLCLNLSSNLKQEKFRSTKSNRSFGGGHENPYKARNIGIGFVIGGAINAGAGAYYIYSFESDPQYWDLDIFLNEIIGAGAIAIGGASIIGGTIATIIGSVQGYRYASSPLKFKSNGRSFGIAYNF